MKSVRIYQSTIQTISLKMPTSKSYGHRSLIAASLAKEVSTIQNLPNNQDIQTTMACLKKLGVSFRQEGSQTTIYPKWKIQNSVVLDCHESGSTLRFLIPLVLIGDRIVKFQGTKQLLERPQTIYEFLAREKEFFFEKTAHSIFVKGPIQAGHFVVDGTISSQFITGLLLALPLLKGDSTLEIQGELVSKDYVEITLDVLRLAGIRIERTNHLFMIPGNQHYQAFKYEVEGDYSSAAFLYALAFLHRKELSIENLNSFSKQADFKILAFLEQVKNRKASSFDLEGCPDLGPILMAVSSQLEGTSHFVNIKRLRFKESDRIEAMREELKKLGIEMKVGENEAFITGGKLRPNQILSGHHDHRIVMALSVLATLTKNTVIEGANAIQKSYPNFFEDLKKLGVRVEEEG